MIERKAYTTEEVAKMMGTTEVMVRYYCRRGYIPFRKVGTRYYIPAWWVSECEKRSPLATEEAGN